jgi:hypothetical protein
MSIETLKIQTHSVTNLPRDLLKIIGEYSTIPTTKKLLSWIDESKLDWKYLSENPNAIELLTKNQDKIDWKLLSLNPDAIELLKQNPDKINWKRLSRNPNAIELLTENPDKIDWSNLSANPNAIELLEENLEKVDFDILHSNSDAMDMILDFGMENDYELIWNWLCSNSHPMAIEHISMKIFEIQNKDITEYDCNGCNECSYCWCDDCNALYNEGCGCDLEIIEERRHDYLSDQWQNEIEDFQSSLDWEELSKNPSAIKLLREHDDLIDWEYLSANPNAMELLHQNPDKINWSNLSSNSNAIELLKRNPDKIDWCKFSLNPNIFEFNIEPELNEFVNLVDQSLYTVISDNKKIETVDKLEKAQTLLNSLKVDMLHKKMILSHLDKLGCDPDTLVNEPLSVIVEIYTRQLKILKNIGMFTV